SFDFADKVFFFTGFIADDRDEQEDVEDIGQIRSAIALDHLKNYIYIEAYKEAQVREACKGMRDVFTRSKIFLVPIKEMTDVLSVVDVDNVRQRVTVKLIPRIDLQALAKKL
nr:putative transcription elongation factor SPT5 homolog 1 [Tanacetum cinerariifolium]